MVESLLLGDMFIHFRVSDKVPRIELSVGGGGKRKAEWGGLIDRIFCTNKRSE